MDNFLDELQAIIKNRAETPVEGSYTSQLIESGGDRILRKVGEEAAELIIAAKNHDALVIKSFEEIYKEAETKFKFKNIAVFIEHIKGYVALGDTSIIIAVACKHRAQAYKFSRYIIEEIKKRTPIWKKEHYENKDSEWLKGKPIKTN